MPTFQNLQHWPFPSQNTVFLKKWNYRVLKSQNFLAAGAHVPQWPKNFAAGARLGYAEPCGGASPPPLAHAPPPGASLPVSPPPGGAHPPHPGASLTRRAFTWGAHSEAPVRPKWGGAWGYRLTHIILMGPVCSTPVHTLLATFVHVVWVRGSRPAGAVR